MDYNGLNETTKTYLKKAMDIYALMMTNEITQLARDVLGKQFSYTFTKLDKKILALFVAGMLVEGDLKRIFEEYTDLKLDDLLSFMQINALDLNLHTSFDEKSYENFFNHHIKNDLYSIVREAFYNKTINIVTPEVIVKCLQFFRKSEILDYFKKYANLNNYFSFSEHPLFDALENYTIEDGSISVIQKPHKKIGGGTVYLTPLLIN